ncbi:MAG: hypothetical protein KJ623_00875 [Nanoarchaeota archaeon]|nr:hypothetical protein [Nanoarchaeota archaeon]MBU0962807.1 hypothetical protein [Nanoarchaeota archaeon]
MEGKDIIYLGVGVLVILGLMFLLNKHADNTRENPNASNSELIGKTMYDTSEDVAIVGDTWLGRLWDSIFGNDYGDQIPPSTINNTATQNATTNNNTLS